MFFKYSSDEILDDIFLKKILRYQYIRFIQTNHDYLTIFSI